MCGDKPILNDVKKFDYEGFIGANCQVYPQLKPENNIIWSNFLELYQKSQNKEMVLIDVRPETHYNIVHLSDFINIPITFFERMKPAELKALLNEDKEKKVFVMCRSGNNSKRAVKFLLSNEILSIFFHKINK